MDRTIQPNQFPAIKALSPSMPKVGLEIVRGQAEEKMRAIDIPAFLIGSANDCDLVLGDLQFPEVYAYLMVQHDGVSIRHLGFAPEMTINGHPVSQARLHDGDRLRTGPYEFVVHISLLADGRRVDRLPFGQLPVGTWDPAKEEPGPQALTAFHQLLRDVRTELSMKRNSIRIYVAPRALVSGIGKEMVAS